MNEERSSTIGRMQEDLATALLESDAYYESMATPLKSALQIKQEHKKHLDELVQMNDFKSKLDQAIQIIKTRLPTMVSEQDWIKVRDQFLNAETYAQEFAVKAQEQEQTEVPAFFQQIMGFTNDTMGHLFKLSRKMVEEADFQNGVAVLTLLSFLNPQIPQYWIGQGICLKNLSKFEDAIASFEIVKLIDTTMALPYLYIAECYLEMDDKSHAKEEAKIAETICKDHKDESLKCGDFLNYIQSKLYI